MALTALGTVATVIRSATAPSDTAFMWARQLDPIGDPDLVEYYRYDSTVSQWIPFGVTNIYHDPVLEQVDTPPGSPSDWDRVLVGSSGVGLFSGQDNKLAIYNGSDWEFYTPRTGAEVFNIDTGYKVYFNGASWGVVSANATNEDNYVIDADNASDGIRLKATSNGLEIRNVGDSAAKNIVVAEPTQSSHAVTKNYADGLVVSQVIHKGGYDADTNSPNLDSSPSGVKQGHMYTITVAGTFYSTGVEVGDVLIADQDDPTLEAHWTIVNKNLDAASIKSAYESNANTNALTDTYVTNWNQAFGWGNHAIAGYITGYTVTEGDVTGHEAAIDHDALNNYLPNEHIDWTSTSAGIGTTGGASFGSVVNVGGTLVVNGTSSFSAAILMYEDTDNGTNFLTIEAPAAISSNKVIAFQDVAGTIALTSDIFVPSNLSTDYGFTDNSSNWNTAHSWGNHASGGYAAASHSHTISALTDVNASAAELNLLNLSGLTSGWVLSADSASTASWKAPSGGGGLSNIVEDTTPELGGQLETQGNSIVGTDGAGISWGSGTITFGDIGDSDLITYIDGFGGSARLAVGDGETIVTGNFECADLLIAGGGIDLGDEDELAFGASRDVRMEYDSGGNTLDLNVISSTTDIHFQTAGTTRFTFNMGTYEATATDWNATSDERLKKSWKTYESVLGRVFALRGSFSHFEWKESGMNDVGYSAQKIEGLFPEIVKTDDKGIKSLSYSKLSGIALEAIAEEHDRALTKEQQLEARIEELEKEVESLMSE